MHRELNNNNKIIPLKNKIYRGKYFKKIYTSIYYNYSKALIFMAVSENYMGFPSGKPSGNNFSTVEDLIN